MWIYISLQYCFTFANGATQQLQVGMVSPVVRKYVHGGGARPEHGTQSHESLCFLWWRSGTG